MILICDSGSTKADWRLIDREGNIHQAQTIGLNPYFVSDEQVLNALQTGPMKLFTPSEIREVHFYGSGVSSPSLVDRLRKIFSGVYPLAEIHIEHDLLGAARALCKDDPGIAVILGTGMNSCAYDGTHIVSNVASLGYVLGDEGSGADLGKRWLRACLMDQAPKALIEGFYKEYGVDREMILERIYSGDRPNRFLASFTPFMYKHLSDPFVLNLVREAFEVLFEEYLMKYAQYKDWKMHWCGSVAYYFRPVLETLARQRGVAFGQVIQKPIAALTLYHLQSE